MKKFLLLAVLIVSQSFLVPMPKKITFFMDAVEHTKYANQLTPKERMFLVRTYTKSSLRYWKGITDQKDKIVREIAPIAVYNYEFKDGLLPSVTVTLAGYERGWCKTGSCKEKNNYFNVKSKRFGCTLKKCNHKVKCSKLYDDEFDKKGRKIKSSFFSFATRWEAFEFQNNLMHNDRYKGALNLKTAKEQITYIRDAGYATLNRKDYISRHTRIAKDLNMLDQVEKQLKKELQ